MRLFLLAVATLIGSSLPSQSQDAKAPPKLGLRPEPVGKIKVKAEWKNKVPPASPAVVDHHAGWKFNMGANNRFGTCGPTSGANHWQMTQKFLFGKDTFVSESDIFDVYRRSGNPRFDPNTGADDNGVVMSDLMAAMKAKAFDGDRCLGYAALEDKSDASVQAAIYEFGGVLLAVNLQTAQQSQTERGFWDYQRSGQWGGHAILSGKYDRNTGRVSVVTWQKEVYTTPNFRRYQLNEVWLPVWESAVKSGKWFRSDIDTAQLSKDWEAITGDPSPFKDAPTPPTPPAPPTPDPVPPAPTAGFTGTLTYKAGVLVSVTPGAAGPAKLDEAAITALVMKEIEKKFPGITAVAGVNWADLALAIAKAIIEALLAAK